MRLRGLIFLIRKNILKKFFRSIILIFSFAFSILILGICLSFLIKVKSEIIPRLKRSFPENQIIISPQTLDFTLIQFSTSAITDATIEKIKNVKGVIGAYPILPLTMPVCAEGRIFGNEMSTDLSVNGVDSDLVKDEIENHYVFSAQNQQYLPVLVSQYFVDLYNLGIAQGSNLPRISKVAIIGRTFNLILGESLVLDSGNKEKSEVIECQVVGLTLNRSLLAVAAPIEKIKEFNEWYTGNKNFKYTRLIVKIESPEVFETLISLCKKLNLTISSEKKTLEQFLFLIRIILYVIFSFTIIIVFLSVIMLTNHYSLTLLERKSEIGIFRVLGGTPFQTFLLYFLESGLIGFIGGIIGITGMLLLINFLNKTISQYFSELSFIPDTFFHTPFWLLIFLPLAGIILSLLGICPLFFKYLYSEPGSLLNEE